MATACVSASDLSSLPLEVFDDSHYASTFSRKIARSLQLGPKYYFFDLPRYFMRRRSLGLSRWDFAALVNPLREFRRWKCCAFPLPDGYPAALRQLKDAGVCISMPRDRLEALLGAWWSVRDVPGDVMECGAYRGATSLLIGLLGQMNGLSQSVLMLDTFTGMPPPSTLDLARHSGEFRPAENQVERITRQAETLGIEARIEIHQGLFSRTFAKLQRAPLRLAFIHVDANIHESTLQACQFTIPRLHANGCVVFDDYNGVCDLGARLAIQQYCRGRHEWPSPLAGSSAMLRA